MTSSLSPFNVADAGTAAAAIATPELMDVGNVHLVIKGYVMPITVLLTLVTNGLVCVVLMQPAMRNPTNALLVAMAAADTLTVLMPMPHYMHFYTRGMHRDWVPFGWCVTEEAFTDHLPTAFHTASVWLTVALAVQR